MLLFISITYNNIFISFGYLVIHNLIYESVAD